LPPLVYNLGTALILRSIFLIPHHLHRRLLRYQRARFAHPPDATRHRLLNSNCHPNEQRPGRVKRRCARLQCTSTPRLRSHRAGTISCVG
ncbi:hypothetical protein CERSUDRAFT_118394, partial [Gelatoporia subvermispora B]